VLGSPFRWYGIVRSVARQGKYRHNKAKKAPGSDHTLLCGYITVPKPFWQAVPQKANLSRVSLLVEG
jgi:hypothetical protein